MLSCTHCRHAAVSRIPQKRKFCKMKQSDCRNHKFPGFHNFMLHAIRGISSLFKHCRGIQDTLNIKEKFCPGFHNFSQFSCPGFHEKQQNSLPVHGNDSEFDRFLNCVALKLPFLGTLELSAETFFKKIGFLLFTVLHCYLFSV